MQFPYRFSCEFSLTIKGPYEKCRCTVQPLSLLMETAYSKKLYNLLEMRNKTNQFTDHNIIVLGCPFEQLHLRISDSVDFRICHSVMDTLVPEGEFSDLWKKQQPLEVLSTQTCQLFTVENKRTRNRMILRKLRLARISTNSQIQFMRLIHNRCLMKPDHIYIENGTLKLLYKPFSGTLLKKHLNKRKVPPQDELRHFVTKMLFFLVDIQTRKMRLTSLREDIILLQGQKFSMPQIIDLSSIQYEEQIGIANRHIWNLGGLLHKIVMMKPPDHCENMRIKKWLAGEIQPFCEALSIYKKSFFEMLMDMLCDNGSKTTLDKLMKHRWFLEKFDHIQPNLRLMSIKSATFYESDFQSEDDQQTSLGKDGPDDNKQTKCTLQGTNQQQLMDPNHEYEPGQITLCIRMSQIHINRQIPFSFML